MVRSKVPGEGFEDVVGDFGGVGGRSEVGCSGSLE